jgi:hypothetical protein
MIAQVVETFLRWLRAGYAVGSCQSGVHMIGVDIKLS